MLPALLLNAGSKSDRKAETGEQLPVWSEGYLDIHAINSARGECTFFILPDGTTMTIDAGEFSSEPAKYHNVSQRPDSLTRPSHTYAAYMKHFAPHKNYTDYLMLSHFHMDHMGQLEPEYIKAKDGDYVLSGITALYHEMPFREIIDRAYPCYDSLACQAMSTASLANYRKFIDFATANNKLKATGFKLGAENQIKLLYNPGRYKNFSISNLCANGHVWSNGNCVNCFTDTKLRENAASCGILIRYGDFDYMTAGDISGNIEVTLAKAIGRPIEALKADHHLSPKTMEPETMEILNPDVIVTQSFYIREIQPDRDIIKRITTNGNTRLYFTNIDDRLISEKPDAYAGCASTGGHVVIRVMPGGKEYYVYVLDDTDMRYRVKRADGPFKCKK